MDNILKNRKRSVKLHFAHWLFLFSLNYLFWHLTVAFLNFEVKNKLMVAELFDLITPFVMTFLFIKLYTLLDKKSNKRIPVKVSLISLVLLIVGIVLFIEGHGIHLAANAISRHLDGLHSTSIFRLTYFFDEILGHLLWDSGYIVISIAFIFRTIYGEDEVPKKSLPLIISGSLLYGFTFFCNAVEGQTVILTMPFSIIILVCIVLLIRCRMITLRQHLIAFYGTAYITALIFFIYWWIANNGFPQFSELGWI